MTHRLMTLALVCLVAVSAAWAEDAAPRTMNPASVMPAEADYYVALDLDAAQAAADQILPQLSQDYWARAREADSLGLAALAAAAPVIQAQLTLARSAAGPTIGVAVYRSADLYGAMLAIPELQPRLLARAKPKPQAKPAPAKPAPAKPAKPWEQALQRLDVVIAAPVREQSAGPMLEALAAGLKAGAGKIGLRLAVHKDGEWLVVATKPARLEQVEAVIAGKRPALAGEPAYQEVMAALPPGGVSVVYADAARFGPAMIGQVRKAFEKAEAEAAKTKPPVKTKPGQSPKPAEAKMANPMDAMMTKYMALYWKIAAEWYGATRGTGSALYVERGGITRRDVYLVDAARMAKVPVLGALSQPAPMSGAALGALPATSLAVAAAGGVGRQARALLDGAAGLDPSLTMMIGAGKGMLGGALGLDLDQDLLPAMERDAAVALLALDVKGDMPVQAALVLQARDEAAAAAMAAKLDAMLTERFKMTSEELTTGSTAFRRVQGPGMPISPCYAQVGDLLLAATSKEALEACLDARAERSRSLAAAPQIEGLMKSPGGASALVFVSAGKVISGLVPVMPAQVKQVIGDGVGLDTIQVAAWGDAGRQMMVLEVRGDMLALAETMARGLPLAAREGVVEALKRKPAAPPKPAPVKRAPAPAR